MVTKTPKPKNTPATPSTGRKVSDQRIREITREVMVRRERALRELGDR